MEAFDAYRLRPCASDPPHYQALEDFFFPPPWQEIHDILFSGVGGTAKGGK